MPCPTAYILVTGASSGLGREIAVRFSQGHRLILHGRNQEGLEVTRAACLDPARHLIWNQDLSNLDDLSSSLADRLKQSDACVVSFIHCAGAVKVLPVRSTTHQVAQSILNVNFLAAVEIINLLLKKRINQDNLRDILFISSIWSVFGSKAHATYCASKAALDGYMRALAVELAPKIRVNSILPGAIHTTMAAAGFQDPEILANLERDYPLGLGKPEDIANMAVFIISPAARWITGQQLIVDGGRTTNMSLR